MASFTCHVCCERIADVSLAAQGRRFHPDCFLCNYCLEPFPDGKFFDVDGHLYCENDYRLLFGSRCARCGEMIQGRCLDALDLKWHPEHFTCEDCGKSLSGGSFVKKDGKALCKPCQLERKRLEEERRKNMCSRCKKPILDGEILRIKHDIFHANHFNCALCRKELRADAKEHMGKLYCPIDYEKVTNNSCFACRYPILGRSITALGKHFHPEHFVCCKCEKPFGTTFYEYEDRAYCEVHYNELSGENCGRCGDPVAGKVVTAMGKRWCEFHFICMGCDKQFPNGMFFEWDTKPVCQGCYNCLPFDVRKRLAKYNDIDKQMAKAAQAKAA